MDQNNFFVNVWRFAGTVVLIVFVIFSQWIKLLAFITRIVQYKNILIRLE